MCVGVTLVPDTSSISWKQIHISNRFQDSLDVLFVIEIIGVDADQSNAFLIVCRSNFGGDSKLVLRSGMRNKSPASIDVFLLREQQPLFDQLEFSGIGSGVYIPCRK